MADCSLAVTNGIIGTLFSHGYLAHKPTSKRKVNNVSKGVPGKSYASLMVIKNDANRIKMMNEYFNPRFKISHYVMPRLSADVVTS
jgi:hypothetical protein